VAELQHVASDAGGNLYLGGIYRGALDLGVGAPPSPFYYVAFVAKLDAQGDVVWLRAYPGQSYDTFVQDLEVDADGRVTFRSLSLGGIIVHGQQVGSTDGAEYIAQLESDGTHRFTLEVDPHMNVVDLALAPEGELVLLGTADSAIDFAGLTLATPGATPSAPTRVLSKLDASGRALWLRELSALQRPEPDRARVGVFPSGAIFVSERQGEEPFTSVLEHFDRNGTALASRSWIVDDSAGAAAYGPITGALDDHLYLMQPMYSPLSIGNAQLAPIESVATETAAADLLVVKAGNDGQPVFVHQVGTEEVKRAAGISVSTDGSVFIAYAVGPYEGTGQRITVRKLGEEQLD
jgi:hypothetical protein